MLFCQCCRPKYFSVLSESEPESISGNLKVVVSVLFLDISVSGCVNEDLKVVISVLFLDISFSGWHDGGLKVVV